MKLFGAVAVFGLLAAVPAIAADYTITRCPPDLPYCIQDTKPAYSREEIERRNAIKINPEEEARKARVRHDAGYRDPGSSSLCPPPYRMTASDGCQLRGR